MCVQASNEDEEICVKHHCTFEICDYTYQHLEINGNCEACPDWYHPDGDGKACIQDPLGEN